MKKKLVVLSGAGISAESGLKTFRDSDGLWEGYDIEEVATPRAWKRNPALVLEFYNQRRQQVLQAVPNLAHQLLAQLEKDFDVTIITQNIDDLHERAGSSHVIHLHGEILKMRSERDASLKASITSDMTLDLVAPDGGRFRPDIVWFEEPVPLITQAIEHAREADLFLVVGTSLLVYPAAGLLEFVPASASVFVIDKKMPSIRTAANYSLIELPATEGMQELTKRLSIS